MNIEKICRCCLTSAGKLFSIYDGGNNANECLAFKMNQVTSVKPKSDDELPDKACILCVSDIHRFHNFKIKCEKSNRMLQQLLLGGKVQNHFESDFNTYNTITVCQDESDKNPAELCNDIDERNTLLSHRMSQDNAISNIDTIFKEEYNGCFTFANCSSVSICETTSEINSEQKFNDSDSCKLEINFNQECNDKKVVSNQLISRKLPDNIEAISKSLTRSAPVKYEDNAANSNSVQILEHVIHDGINDVLPYHHAICIKELLNNHELVNHLETHDKQYSCTWCNGVFNDYTALNKHLLEQTANNKCISSSSSRAQTHNKRYACELCRKLYYSSRDLEIHYRIHTGERPFKCSYCDKSFTLAHVRTNHERTHTGEKPFKCSYCDKSFTQSHVRVSHERTHTGERPFKCSYCDKSYTQAHVRISHERTHTGEKPFKCSYCDKSFSRVQHQINHERTHTGEKPFKCRYCDKSFIHNHVRIIHERTHTGERPFKCSYCDKRFTQVQHRVSHEKIHIERPFKCSYCDKGFKRASAQKNHERIHTGKIPF